MSNDDLFGPADYANTPLDPNESQGLKPSQVATRAELNELEQRNILQAEAFAFRRRHDPLAERFGRNLHRRMFGDVWSWAGAYRTSNKNIGVDRIEIVVRLYQLNSDTRYQIDNTTYPPDEIAARFHHGLVYVHPFPNGNGRWSRLMADILLARMGRRRFAIDTDAAASNDDLRRRYIAALQAADAYDFKPLVTFLRPERSN